MKTIQGRQAKERHPVAAHGPCADPADGIQSGFHKLGIAETRIPTTVIPAFIAGTHRSTGSGVGGAMGPGDPGRHRGRQAPG